MTIGVQGRLKAKAVKTYAEGFEVEVLFSTQVGHSKMGNGIKVLQAARACYLKTVGCNNGLALLVGLCNVQNVVTPVAVLRKGGVMRCDGFGAGLHRDGQIIYLGTGIVVVELSGNPVALGLENGCKAVA